MKTTTAAWILLLLLLCAHRTSISVLAELTVPPPEVDQMTNSESFFEREIVTDEDCKDFVETRHKYARVQISMNYGNGQFVIGRNLSTLLCVERCLPEGKILVMPFIGNIKPHTIVALSRKTGLLNVWLSFKVANGPNCPGIITFRKQVVKPYNSTIVSFCEETGPQTGYTIENLRSMVVCMDYLKNTGDLYAEVDGQYLLNGEDDINWRAIKWRSKKIIVKRLRRKWERTAMLREINGNITTMIFDPPVGGARKWVGDIHVGMWFWGMLVMVMWG